MLESKYIEEEIFTPENSKDFSIFKGNEFIDCEFSSIDFTGVNFSGSKFVGCSFKKCNLSNITILSTCFRDVIFESCKSIGINFSDCINLYGLNFNNCILDYSIFQDLEVLELSFNSCGLKEVDFSQSKLLSAKFIACDLSGAIFSGSDLSKSDFSRSTNYFIDIAYTKIKRAKFSMPEVITLLNSLDIVID